MKTTTKLLLLALADFVLIVAFARVQWQNSSFYTLLLVLQGKVLNDSSAFMGPAWQMVRSGRPLYPTLFFEQQVKFIYPTSSLLLGYVTEWLHVSFHGLIAWMVIISWMLTLVVAGEIFVRLLPEEKPYWQLRLLVALLGVFFYPLLMGVRFGQMQTVLTFLFTLAVLLWMLDRKAAAGVCLALACAVKPPLGLFLLWGLLRREWRFVAAFLSATVVIQALAVALFGWQNEIGYLAVLSYIGRRGECIGENQSVNGWLQRMFDNGEGGTGLYPPYNAMIYLWTAVSSAVLVVAGLVVPVWRRWKDPLADFVLFGLLSTIASPIVWTHHYGVFYVASVYFLAVGLRQTGHISAWFVFWFLLLSNFIHMFGKYYWVRPQNLFFSYELYAGLGILWLMAFGLRHDRASMDSVRS